MFLFQLRSKWCLCFWGRHDFYSAVLAGAKFVDQLYLIASGLANVLQVVLQEKKKMLTVSKGCVSHSLQIIVQYF